MELEAEIDSRYRYGRSIDINWPVATESRPVELMLMASIVLDAGWLHSREIETIGT